MSSKRKHSDSTDSNDDNKRPRVSIEGQRYKLSYPSTSKSAGNNIKPVAFQQPLPLVTFSYTPSHVLEFNDSALRYYVDPPPHADLNYGYDRWIRRPEAKGRIDALLRAWIKAKEKLPEGTMKGGVITWRGVMTKILTAPYEERDGFELNVMCIDGVFYLEDHVSDEKLREREVDMTPRQRRQIYYGYSFESFCTSSTPHVGQQPGWSGDVNTNVQWCSVVKTKLGDTRLLLGGEVDCVRGKLTSTNDTFVELKTSMTIRGPSDEVRFERKLLKYYIQSFLLGVPEIVVGFRTPAGKLATLQSFKTMQIPRLVRNKPDAWDPGLCLEFGHRLLEFVKNIITDEAGTGGPDIKPKVWRVQFVPREGVWVHMLDEIGVEEVRAGEERSGFLPNWYWEEMVIRHKSSMLDPVIPANTKGSAVLQAGWTIG